MDANYIPTSLNCKAGTYKAKNINLVEEVDLSVQKYLMLTGFELLLIQLVIGVVPIRFYISAIAIEWHETKDRLSPVFSGYWLRHCCDNFEPGSSLK